MALGTAAVRLRGRLRSLIGAQAHSGATHCNAPFASMYLDQRGDVRACCQNAGWPLGNVTEGSLRDIWHSDSAVQLRDAVGRGDLSLGCSFCHWQLEAGSDNLVFARTFDHLPTEREPRPQWPKQLELSLSNACNLQCVMCNGEWSSSIRTHREGLPPLPKVYGEKFFSELAEFLPHLEVVKFLGGEPFLGAESLRVMEMLAESAPHVVVHVTTNGTQWSPRIERILERLNVNIAVSLDGVRQPTYEAIRVGAELEAVLANVERFAAYCSERGSFFSMSHCLMTANWSEFDQFLDLAERLDCSVYVNTVTEPYEVSLYHLAPAELRDVVVELESRDRAVRARLSERRSEVWRDQLTRLRGHLEAMERHEPPEYVAKRRTLGFAWLAPQERSLEALGALGERSSSTGCLVELDGAGVVRQVAPTGDPDDALLDAVAAHIADGAPQFVKDPTVKDDFTVVREDLHTYDLTLTDTGAPVRVQVVRAAVRDESGLLVGVRLLLIPRG